jgi:hypothetical protein
MSRQPQRKNKDNYLPNGQPLESSSASRPIRRWRKDQQQEKQQEDEQAE